MNDFDCATILSCVANSRANAIAQNEHSRPDTPAAPAINDIKVSVCWRSSSRILPRSHITAHPRPAFPVSKLDRGLREVFVTAHVRGDAVLVRETEELCHLTDVDEVVEIYLTTHDFESIHVDSVTSME